MEKSSSQNPKGSHEHFRYMETRNSPFRDRSEHAYLRVFANELDVGIDECRTWGRSVLVTVHNVPEELLDKATQDYRVERPVVVGAFNADNGAVSILSRVRIGDVEYHLTS